MSCLLLRLEAPLQSWGYRSRFTDRDTGLEPTKSGVVGLLCCALGRDRSESPADLAELKMHVRVDREGILLTDFHTAGGGIFRGSRKYFAPKSSGGEGGNAVVTHRHYLQDASFLVALEGDPELLTLLAQRLRDPAWPLSLGRRSCPPTIPVLVEPGVRPEPALELLRREPLARPRQPDKPVRMVIECDKGTTAGDIRKDVPVIWPHSLRREYTVRFVRTETVLPTTEASQ